MKDMENEKNLAQLDDTLLLEQMNDVLCEFQMRANRNVVLRENIDTTINDLLELPGLRSKDGRIAELEEALNHIAAWNEGPVVTSSFDSPWTARIARAALSKEQEL